MIATPSMLRRRFAPVLLGLALTTAATACDSPRSDGITAPPAQAAIAYPLRLTVDAQPGVFTVTRSGIRHAGPQDAALPLYRVARNPAGNPGSEVAYDDLQPVDETPPCPIAAGTYVIYNANRQPVGILIVYPNCESEIRPLS